jgi:DNA-binding CsgD family transcriptional regulator
LRIAMFPFSEGGLSGPGDALDLVIVVLFEAQLGGELFLEVLRNCFELTETEAVVAKALLEQHDLKLVARALNVSYETVRVHLKRVFKKTRTNGQTELVALILRLRELPFFYNTDSGKD